VTVDFFSPQKMRFKINSTTAGSLVLLQNHFKNWQATVDGKKVPINKAFISFMSVAVNEGEHVVEFTYKDKLLKAFIFISLSTFVLLLAVVVIKKRLPPGVKN
jgi:uncharacterized membrane protein YfhO